MKISNELYDALKWVCQVVLPGLATLYYSLSLIWGLPLGEQVVGTIAAITTCLGVFLGISTANYRTEIAKKETKEAESFDIRQ